MPEIDFNIDELEKYKGINPSPSDLDQYWREAMEELDSFPWDITYSPSEFQAPGVECFDLYFTGVGGARIYAKYLKPQKIGNDSPAILQFHGYLCTSGEWSEKLKYAYAGFTVLAMDCRGQGGKSWDSVKTSGLTMVGHIVRGLNDGEESLTYRSIFLDCAQLGKIAMGLPGVDRKRVATTGYSQGGALSLACAALVPEINRVAPVYPFLSDYKRVWDMDLDKGAYGELRTFFRMYDPNHLNEDKTFHTLGYIDIKNLAKRVKAQVFMGITLMDTVCPPSTQFAAYNNLETDKKKIIFYDHGHENLPGMDDKIFTYLLEMKYESKQAVSNIAKNIGGEDEN